MGQKVNPIGFRIGVRGCKKWPSIWFKGRDYADTVLEDIKIREFLYKNYAHTKIGAIVIERSGDHVRVIVHSAAPGILIGKKGQDIENLRKVIAQKINRTSVEVSIKEITDPMLCARVVAYGIAEQIEKRVSFKRVMKKYATDIMQAGAKGVRIRIAGRLDGAEIARDEHIKLGSVPLHTIRADIDYSTYEARTTYGIIGIKVWICRGEYRSAMI